MKIIITETEYVLIQSIAIWRNTKARMAGITDMKIDSSRNSVTIDIEGMLGEWAVAKSLDVPISMILQPTGDGGIFDFNYKNKLVEVKSTRYPNGRLIVSDNKKIGADAYVLCVVDGMTVDIKGCISRHKFLSNHKILKLDGVNPCKAVEQSQLSPLSILKEWATSQEVSSVA